MKVMIVEKRMRDRVVMPHVETLREKAALQANALKVEQLPKNWRDKTCENWAQLTDHEVVWDHSSSGGTGLGKEQWSDEATG